MKRLALFVCVFFGCLSASANEALKVEFKRIWINFSNSLGQDVEKSVLYSDSLLDLAKQIDETYYLGIAYNNIGVIHHLGQSIDSAIFYQELGLKMLSQHLDSIAFLDVQYNLAGNYLRKQNFAKAIFHTSKAVSRIEDRFDFFIKRYGDLIYLSKAHYITTMGISFHELKDYERALKLFKEAQMLAEPNSFRKKNGDESISTIYSNLADCYYQLTEYDSARHYCLRSIEMDSAIGRPNLSSINYYVLASIFYHEGKYDESLKNLELSNALSLNLGNQIPPLENVILKAKCHLQKNELQKSRLALEEIQISNYQDKEKVIQFYEVDGMVQEKLGNLDRAFALQSKVRRMQAELITVLQTNVVDNIDLLYELQDRIFESKFEELKRQEQARIQAITLQKEKEKQTLINWIYVGVLVGLVLLVLVTLVAFNRKKKINLILADSIKQKEILFKEVHHRVKNNFQLISSLLNLQEGKVSDEKSKKELLQAKTRIRSMSLVHDMLYKKERVNEIEFKTYASDLSESILDSFQSEYQEIQSNIVSNEVYFDLETATPLALILNELITNSVKHAFKDIDFPEIKIELIELDNKGFKLIFSDNGVGISKEQMKDNAETLGIEMITILIEQLNGSVEFKSEQGTQVTLLFKP